MRDAGRTVALSLRGPMAWSDIDGLRCAVEAVAAAALADGDRGAALGLAAHELLQNALAHAPDHPVALELAAGPAGVRIAVSNRCDAASAAAVATRLAAIQADPDPLRAYLAALRATALDAPGGLGLARVRCEAGLDLRAIRRGDELTVEGSASAAPGAPSPTPAQERSDGSP